jgi:hypothetical protein
MGPPLQHASNDAIDHALPYLSAFSSIPPGLANRSQDRLWHFGQIGGGTIAPSGSKPQHRH